MLLGKETMAYILAIDDSARMRHMVAIILKGSGYEVAATKIEDVPVNSRTLSPAALNHWLRPRSARNDIQLCNVPLFSQWPYDTTRLQLHP